MMTDSKEKSIPCHTQIFQKEIQDEGCHQNL